MSDQNEMMDWLMPVSEKGKAAPEPEQEVPAETEPVDEGLAAEAGGSEPDWLNGLDDDDEDDLDEDFDDEDFEDEDESKAADEDEGEDEDESDESDEDGEELPVIEINSDENADWMRVLEQRRKADDPDYVTDAELHERIARGEFRDKPKADDKGDKAK